MTWAFKRQFFYVFILVLFILVFGFLIIYPKLNKEPSCFDRKQNGEETGVDCGGLCIKACLADVDKISIHWARSFRVIPGRYNAVAYLENHNENAVVNKINYRFRFADANNLYIGKREGSTFIPSSGRFAIFEPGVGVGNSVPVYTTFEFTQIPEWVMVSEKKKKQLKLSVSNIILLDEKTSPKLSARVKNTSLFTIPSINVVAILYDTNRNAISASSTFIDELVGETSKEVHFIWPEPVSSPVVVKEILPIYNIDLVKFK